MKKNQLNSLNPIFLIPNILPRKSVFENFNFEFMDLHFLPNNLRSVLRDILEIGSSAPFRNYYEWIAASVYEFAIKNKIAEIVELGAGNAPITRCLIKNYPDWNIKFRISDLNPDQSAFKLLVDSDERVIAEYAPLDFTKKMPSYQNSLLVLSAAFHHVPEKNKNSILKNLKTLSRHVFVFEPVRPKLPSLLLNLGILLTGFLTPFFKIKSRHFWRSVFWCWLIPMAPFLLLWDGTVSVFRCWSKQVWLSNAPQAEVTETLFCIKVIL